MQVRLPFILVGLASALGVYAGLSIWHSRQRAELVGLTGQPCASTGRSVTGHDFDDFAGLCVWREENRALLSAKSPVDVVMIGDSLIERWPVRKPGIVTRGVGGQTSAQVLIRFRQDAIALHPRTIHLLVGTNDLLGLGGPFTIAQFSDRVRDMIDLARLQGASVILGTIPPMRDYAGFKPGNPAPAVAQINDALRKAADTGGVALADYHAALSLPDGSIRQELFLEDGLHLKPEGYKVLQSVFDAALLQLTGEPTSSTLSGSR